MSSRERNSRDVAGHAAELERELARMHDEVSALQSRAAEDAADIVRLRGELATARAQIASLGRDPEVVQAAAFKKRLADAEAARAISDRVASKALRESQVLEEQLASVREEIRIARERMTADAVRSATVADELAALRRETQIAKAQSLTTLMTATTQLEAHISELTELNATATIRADQAEAQQRAAELRAQHAETRLEQASTRAATAEARAAYLDKRVSSHDILSRQADEEYALAQRQIVALETRLAAMEASATATEPAAAKLVPQQQVDHAGELEQMVAAAGEIAVIDPPSDDAMKRAIRIAAALSDKQIREAAHRVEDAENRANVSTTLAKAMAKDVAEALRRAAEADLSIRNRAAELEATHRRAEQAEAERAKAAGAIAETERRASEAEARASHWQSELARASAESRKVSSAGQTMLESIRRELAAERSTGAALADCKRQLDDELAELRAQLSATIARTRAVERRNVELEREVATADNVRSFAAETEREIAQLQRQLHDARSALAEIAVERDRLVTAAYDTHSDRAPTNPLGEDTVRYDVPGLEQLVRRTAGLEDRVVELERDNAQLRDQLVRAKRRAR